MNTGEVRRPVKAYVRNSRRRKLPLNVDLNVPPGDGLEEIIVPVDSTVPSVTVGSSGYVEQAFVGSGSGGSGSQAPAAIDVEAIDDEVVISSPRRFAEAKQKRRRTGNPDSRVHPGLSVEEVTRLSLNNLTTTRRRIPSSQTIIDCEQYVDLEKYCGCQTEAKKAPSPPPPPKELIFSCPVCMGPLVEEVSTKCGHIFCRKCIKAAISAQNKCPTCRRKVTMKDIIRIYLPATSLA